MGGTTGKGINACRYDAAVVQTEGAGECVSGGSITCVNGDCLCTSPTGDLLTAYTNAEFDDGCEQAFTALCFGAQASPGWKYGGSSGCTFQGTPGDGVGAAASSGTSGTTGTSGAVACAWTGLDVDINSETCSPGTTISCVDSHCICFSPDGGFLAAFTDGAPGQCMDNLSLCASAGGTTSGGSTGSVTGGALSATGVAGATGSVSATTGSLTGSSSVGTTGAAASSSTSGSTGTTGELAPCAPGPTPAAQPQPTQFVAVLVATAGPNHDIYLLQDSNFQRLDIESGQWTPAAPPPSGWFNYGVSGMASAGGKVYAFDGVNVGIYDPASDAWIEGTPQPTPENAPNATLGPDGKIYLMGYWSTLSDGSGSQFWTYDPVSDSWDYLPNAPFSGDGTGITTGPDGRIYMVGPNAAAYDITQRKWHRLYDPPNPYYWVGVAFDSAGQLLDIGGGNANTPGWTQTVSAYDLDAGTWGPFSPTPDRSGEATSVHACDGKVYVFGSAMQIWDGTSWQVVQ